jgi:hypothetical protein
VQWISEPYRLCFQIIEVFISNMSQVSPRCPDVHFSNSFHNWRMSPEGWDYDTSNHSLGLQHPPEEITPEAQTEEMLELSAINYFEACCGSWALVVKVNLHLMQMLKSQSFRVPSICFLIVILWVTPANKRSRQLFLYVESLIKQISLGCSASCARAASI